MSVAVHETKEPQQGVKEGEMERRLALLQDSHRN